MARLGVTNGSWLVATTTPWVNWPARGCDDTLIAFWDTVSGQISGFSGNFRFSEGIFKLFTKTIEPLPDGAPEVYLKVDWSFGAYSGSFTFGSRESCSEKILIPSIDPSESGFLNIVVTANAAPPCNNIPDGSAFISVIATDYDGNKIAVSKPFDYTQGIHQIDVSEMFSSPLESLILGGSSGVAMTGYIVNAPKGFTAGKVRISELFHTVQGGFFEQAGWEGEIDLAEGQNKGNIISPHHLIKINSDAGFPVPLIFTGKVNLNCSFASLPECLPDSGDETTPQEYIAEQPVVYPPIPQGPVPPLPVEPIVPIGPYPPVEPIVEPLPPDVLLPSQPVEPAGCECEIYVGKQVSRIATAVALGSTALNKTLTSLLGSMKTLIKNVERTNLILEEGFSLIGVGLDDGLQEIVEEMRYDTELITSEFQKIEEKLRLDPCLPDYPDGQTVTEVLKEFVEQYEPPLVEVLESDIIVNGDGEKSYSRRNFE